MSLSIYLCMNGVKCYPQSYVVGEENNAVCRLRSNLNRTVFRNKLLISEQKVTLGIYSCSEA